MSRLGRLGSKIEGGNNANCDSSNQQLTHVTLLCLGHGAWVLLKAYTLRLTKFITSRRLGLWLRLATPDLGITVQCKNASGQRLCRPGSIDGAARYCLMTCSALVARS